MGNCCYNLPPCGFTIYDEGIMSNMNIKNWNIYKTRQLHLKIGRIFEPYDYSLVKSIMNVFIRLTVTENISLTIDLDQLVDLMEALKNMKILDQFFFYLIEQYEFYMIINEKFEDEFKIRFTKNIHNIMFYISNKDSQTLSSIESINHIETLFKCHRNEKRKEKDK